VLIMPIILVLLFGYGVNLDLKRLPIYVYDRDGNQQSQDLLKRFQASDYFEIVRVVNNYRDLTHAIDDGHAKMGIVIPWDFSERVRDGRPAQVQALVDGTDDNTANVLIGYAQAVTQGYSSDIQLDWLHDRGQIAQPAPVSVETRTWYNEDLESSAFIVPGVLALVMSVIGAFLTSLTIAREWERGTMEQLISTPASPLEIMFGKLVPYFAIGMVDVMVCALIALYWFHVPFRGSFLTLLVSSAMFMIVPLDGIFPLGDCEEPVGGESTCFADNIPAGVPIVRVSICDRADAGCVAVDHAYPSGALLRLGVKEDIPKGLTGSPALRGSGPACDFYLRAGSAGHAFIPEEADLGEDHAGAPQADAHQGIHPGVPG
jgi:ABC-2 type transport system permease protein